ncbi:T6SS immunity protein Tdi1 domain-containing protein [Cohnella caldifontis]|uniref:T6SS immunity protein Tdi1 domain-containing protein n=1 Tax=Cohnella caldifontis TaxID=3027471 RepID=UPI0023ECA848|nr:T6SS immunity protein Tdi1 domain-containing protein [Cohnella sp. YIM B05605]
MTGKILVDFKFQASTPDDVIKSYTGAVPESMLEIWNQYGFGSFLGGYLKTVNPDLFQPILKDVYVRHRDALVLFTTSMGDIIVWEDNKYLIQLNFRRGKIKGISSGITFFFSDLEDESFLEENLDWLPYPEAVQKLGEPGYEECFAYTPSLALGGSEKLENLNKAKLVEHIYLMKEVIGPIE